MTRKILLSLLLLCGLTVFGVTAQDDLATEVRFGHFAADAVNVDVYYNGELALEDYEPTWLSGFVEVEPGTLDVVITPTGEGIDRPLVKTRALTIEDGHGYSIALIGQDSDRSLRALVIDETAEIGDCDMSQNVFRITINNIAGSPPISFHEGGMWIETNIEYGDFAAVCVPAFFSDTGSAVIGEDLNDPLFTFDDEVDGSGGFWEPYVVYLWGMMGEYPGTPDEDYYFGGGDWYTLADDPPAFLEAFSGLGLTYDSEIFLEFDQIVQAMRDTGVDQVIQEQEEVTMFVPTDQALNALPPKVLDSLLTDPDALRQALLYHIVPGDYSLGDLLDAGTVETLQGSTLEITQDAEDDAFFYLNGVASVENYDYPILDGTTVYFINNLSFLLPE